MLVERGGDLLSAEKRAERLAVENLLRPVGVDRNGTMKFDRMPAPIQNQKPSQKSP